LDHCVFVVDGGLVVVVAEPEGLDETGVVEVEVLEFLEAGEEVLDLVLLQFEGVVQFVVFGLELLDLAEQLHLVLLQLRVLENYALLLLRPASLERDHDLVVAAHDWRVPAERLRPQLQQLLLELSTEVLLRLHRRAAHLSYIYYTYLTS
jgi:hypothetical protein